MHSLPFLFTLIFSVFYWIGVFSSEIAGYQCQKFKKYLGEENFITRKKKRQRLMGDVFDKLKIEPPKKIPTAIRIIGMEAILEFRLRKSWLGRLAGA